MTRELKPIADQRHHDGHGLADRLLIVADARDPHAGSASHHYRVYDAETGAEFARIQFQHGPPRAADSEAGILDGVLLAVLLDRFHGFQSGVHAAAENESVLRLLEEALGQIKARADRRAAAGTLGTRRGA